MMTLPNAAGGSTDDDRFGMDLADRMTKALRHSGIGVQGMADALEVSRNAVSSWINGRNRPRARDLKAFALRTGYPIEWLLKGESSPMDLSIETSGEVTVGPAGLEPTTFTVKSRRFTAEIIPFRSDRKAG